LYVAETVTDVSSPAHPEVAWWPVGAVAAALTALLLATAGSYDYHRDELYFRLLGQHPDWGYVDQPPFTPLLTRLSIDVLGDTVWAIRTPYAFMAGILVILSALIAREVGGGRAAQVLATTGMLAAFPLIAGHMTITDTPDMIVWLLVVLFAMRALLRGTHRSWLWLGLVVGLGLYNKYLVILLLLCLAAGLLVVGPRRVLWSPWVWAGLGIAVVVGLPNLVWQVAAGFPQLSMAHALAVNKGDDARTTMLPLQIIMLGVTVAPIWVAGIVTLLRDRALRPVRALAVAYLVMVPLLLVIAGQPYYTIAMLLILYAVGCVPTVRWFAGRPVRRVLLAAAIVVNVAVSVVLALPVVPVGSLHATPIPAINPTTRDQIGWQTYVRQIAGAYDSLSPADKAVAVLLTGNYGEAGALDRFGRAYGLPKVYSGQNQLYHFGPPPESATVVVVVFEDGRTLLGRTFGSCTAATRLINGVGVDNEEEGATVWICRKPVASWRNLWPSFQHFD
jgi:4-amino-4-deoxy-L-arabinose transferase-like glycosyltransferase